jgi:hypothetical protein
LVNKERTEMVSCVAVLTLARMEKIVAARFCPETDVEDWAAMRSQVMKWTAIMARKQTLIESPDREPGVNQEATLIWQDSWTRL